MQCGTSVLGTILQTLYISLRPGCIIHFTSPKAIKFLKKMSKRCWFIEVINGVSSSPLGSHSHCSLPHRYSMSFESDVMGLGASPMHFGKLYTFPT